MWPAQNISWQQLRNREQGGNEDHPPVPFFTCALSKHQKEQRPLATSSATIWPSHLTPAREKQELSQVSLEPEPPGGMWVASWPLGIGSGGLIRAHLVRQANRKQWTRSSPSSIVILRLFPTQTPSGSLIKKPGRCGGPAPHPPSTTPSLQAWLSCRSEGPSPEHAAVRYTGRWQTQI